MKIVVFLKKYISLSQTKHWFKDLSKKRSLFGYSQAKILYVHSKEVIVFISADVKYKTTYAHISKNIIFMMAI